ncbi:hypothetical protein Tco_1110957, partial [Tanacetum coccineum]
MGALGFWLCSTMGALNLAASTGEKKTITGVFGVEKNIPGVFLVKQERPYRGVWEFDDDPVTFAMVALNGIEEDDWSIEIDADHVDLGQDGFGVFDWSEEADNAPVALALMAKSSTDSSNSEGDKYEQMEYDLKMRDWKLGKKQKELENVIKERDELKEKHEKWSNATLLQTEILNKQKVLSDKTCIGFGVEYSSSEESNNSSGDETLTGPLYENFKREKAYKAVPPPT